MTERNVYKRPDITNGWWQHYKGPIYEVYGLSQREDTGAWEVLYRNPRSGECFHRPASEWRTPMAHGRARFSNVDMKIGEQNAN